MNRKDLTMEQPAGWVTPMSPQELQAECARLAKQGGEGGAIAEEIGRISEVMEMLSARIHKALNKP